MRYIKLVEIMGKIVSFIMGIGCTLFGRFLFILDGIFLKALGVLFFVIGMVFISLIFVD